jgi:hypothetical protein
MSPTMSGIAASCSQPCASTSMIFGVSLSRSTIGAARPAATARSMSLAFSACSAGTPSRSITASVRSAWFFTAAGAAAIRAEAWRACSPSVCMYSAMLRAFMRRIFAWARSPRSRAPQPLRERATISRMRMSGAPVLRNSVTSLTE